MDFIPRPGAPATMAARESPGVCALPDGRVVAVGGLHLAARNNTATATVLASAEILCSASEDSH